MARVLIVEDDPTNAEIAAIICRRDGHQVLIAHSCEEARTLLAGTDSFAVVLIDVRLPDGNGIDLAAEIKGSPQHATAVLIGLTASVDRQTRSDLLSAGARDVLHKPYGVVDLTSALARCLSR